MLVYFLVGFPSISDFWLPYASVLASGTSFSCQTSIPLILTISTFGHGVPWINHWFLYGFGWNREKISIIIHFRSQGDDNPENRFPKVNIESQVMWSSHMTWSLWNLWPCYLWQDTDRNACCVYVTSQIFPSLSWYQISLKHVKQSLLELLDNGLKNSSTRVIPGAQGGTILKIFCCPEFDVDFRS